MNKKFVLISVFVSLFCFASLALAQGGGGTITNPLGFDTFSGLLTNMATEVGAVIATLGAIMIIVAGILYLTSAGSPERIGVAKKALIYAIIGLVVGLSSQAIIDTIKEIIKTKAS